MKQFCLISLLILLNVFSQTSAETASVATEFSQESTANTSTLSLGNDNSQALNHPLPVNKAFKLSAILLNKKLLTVRWLVEQDYYLYKDKFSFSVEEASIENVNFPEAKIKNDEFFGEVSVYTAPLEIEIEHNKNTKKDKYYNNLKNKITLQFRALTDERNQLKSEILKLEAKELKLRNPES